MEKIIIYGLGRAFENNREFWERNFNVVGYSDKRECMLRNVVPNELYKQEADYIMVSSEKYYKEISEELAVKYHIPKDKILSLSEWYVKKYNLCMKDNRKTSIADNGIYPTFCLLASGYKEIFKDFRSNPIIRGIIESLSQSLGQSCLDVIGHNSEVLFSESDWTDFAKNDLYGLPKKYSYRILGKNLELSPTTIRYVKVLQDIMSLFDINKIKNIVEIGVGYGGQCRIISQIYGGGYWLVDLPEVLPLVRTYLSKYSLDGMEYIDGTKDIPNRKFDLAISNYAFSELNRGVQNFYLDNIIDHATSGYITWNSLSYEGLAGYSVEELLGRIKGSFVITEEPLTYEGNCIIVWGVKKTETDRSVSV